MALICDIPSSRVLPWWMVRPNPKFRAVRSFKTVFQKEGTFLPEKGKVSIFQEQNPLGVLNNGTSIRSNEILN